MPRHQSLLVRGVDALTFDGGTPARRRPLDLRLRGQWIEAVGALQPLPGERILEGAGLTAVPGFVQGHLHLCQTLFRGCAEDLALMPWLQQRIWPLEAALDPDATAVAARLAVHELLASGTTTVQTMESTRHFDAVAAVLEQSPLTAITGPCLMDIPGPATTATPSTSTEEATVLMEQGLLRTAAAANLHYAVSPRFLLSCSDPLLRAAARFATDHGLRIHTHACEHPDESAAVAARFGTGALPALEHFDLLGPRTAIAHGVQVDAEDRALLRATGTAVLHCPGTNLKLGSGIAPVSTYLEDGIPLALGADGAPCNNRLSALTVLRETALLQSLAAGPGALPAAEALALLTRDGARALGFADRGTLAPGQRADLCLFDLSAPELSADDDPATTLVYAADERHLRQVFAGGRPVAPEDPGPLLAAADHHRHLCLQRAGLCR